jgi:UDP-N-acetylmuramate--alanine ligase
MHIYISGIGGVGMGPLAELAQDAGYHVTGSDLREGLMSREVMDRGIDVIFEQSEASIAAEHLADPIDWFIYTSALPEDHPELKFARAHGIKVSKRDEFLNEFIREHGLKLLAVAGTHGKTTTTGMFAWTFEQLGIPVSYSIGTTVPFGPAGKYDPKSEYFVYECDEYDRNFLAFNPDVAVITALDYDHHETYPTPADYKAAFREFIGQSGETLLWKKDYKWLDFPENYSADLSIFTQENLTKINLTKLAGEKFRENAFLVSQFLLTKFNVAPETTVKILTDFPGTSRRFEKLKDNLYTDYAHHPAEIKATIEKARELNPNVIVVYEPHQNRRQHEIKNGYKHAFDGAKKIYWLPTYLTREDPNEAVLTPEDLIKTLANPSVAIPAELDDNLFVAIDQARARGDLVLVMGAGSVDGWLRKML